MISLSMRTFSNCCKFIAEKPAFQLLELPNYTFDFLISTFIGEQLCGQKTIGQIAIGRQAFRKLQLLELGKYGVRVFLNTQTNKQMNE